MDRREFLKGIVAVAGVSLGVQSAAESAMRPAQKNPMAGRFSLGNSECCVEWRWPEDKPKWTMSSRDGIQWFSDGPLTEQGREIILRAFAPEADFYKVLKALHPLETLQNTSPTKLMAERRSFERDLKLQHLTVMSDRSGDPIHAEYVA